MEPILRYCSVEVSFHGRAVTHNVSFALQKGEILGIVGESGSGKSTLLKAALGLLGTGGLVTRGDIWFQGKDLPDLPERELRRICGGEIGMIFQDAGLYLDPRRKIGAQFAEMLRVHRKISRKQALEIASEQLSSLSLAAPDRILDSYPFELSGGMKQRTAIGMAMALHPTLLLADEPTSALDVTNGAQVARLLRDLCDRQGISILMVTHNIGLAAAIGDRIAVMRRGKLVEYGTQEQVIGSPREEYTAKLLASVPKLDR